MTGRSDQSKRVVRNGIEYEVFAVGSDFEDWYPIGQLDFLITVYAGRSTFWVSKWEEVDSLEEFERQLKLRAFE